MTLRFAAQNFVAYGLALRCQTVHRGMVFVFDGDADIPVLGTVLGFLQKDLVVHDHPLLLFLLDQRLGGLSQTGEIGVHLSGLHADQLNAPDRTFGVMLLRK